jgi:hypothetical protein
VSVIGLERINRCEMHHGRTEKEPPTYQERVEGLSRRTCYLIVDKATLNSMSARASAMPTDSGPV